MTRVEDLTALLSDGGLFTSAKLYELGFSRATVFRAVEENAIARFASGLYASHEQATEPEAEMAALALKNPDAVVCLLSAAQVHEISDDLPSRIWMAVPRSHKNPLNTSGFLPAYTLWWGQEMFEHGVETRRMAKVDVKVTNLPRTVVDMIRYRKKLGDEQAVRSLHDYMRLGADVGDLWSTAKAIGALDAMEPFIRAADEFRESVQVRRM